MKKFLIISVLIFSLFFFVSCGGDDDEGDTTPDTGDSSADTDTSDSGTADNDITDTETPDIDNTDTTEPADNDPGQETGDDTNDTETEEPDDTDTGSIEPGDCPVITLGQMKFDGSADSYAYYSGSYQPGTGTATPDEIDFEIYSETTTGVYDLTEGYNASYSSCAQCIIVYEDIVYDDGYFDGAGKYYYPASGTMTVNFFSYDSGSLNITLENVKLIEGLRKYEDGKFSFEPTENGACIVIQNTTLNI